MNLLEKFSKLYFLILIIFLLLFELFIIYKFYNPNITFYGAAPIYNSFINNFIIILFFLISSLIFFLIKNKNKKINYFLIHFSTVFTLFFFNLILEISNLHSNPAEMIKKFEKEKGIEWDERMPEEVIKDLKNLLGKENIYKISNPPGFITGDIAQKIKLKSDIVPLSNISNSTILHCNEVGVWETFESDKYGFNNPKEIISRSNKKNLNLLLIGDSFIEGACSGKGNDISSKMRSKGYNVLNLGKAGSGLFAGIARMREYQNAYNFDYDYLVYFIYGDNDLTDTAREYAHPFYKKYINDKKFTQNLSNRQEEVDEYWKSFFSIIGEKDFLAKNPFISKFGQTYVPATELYKAPEFKHHLKNVLLFSNIRSLIKENLTKNFTNLESKERDRQFKIIEEAVIAFKNELNEKAKFVIVYLPSYSEIKYKKKTNFQKEIPKILYNSGIFYFNANERFKELNIKDIFEFGYGLGHYSSDGYGHLADFVDQFLIEVEKK